MASILKKVFRIPEPVGDTKPVRHFEASQTPLDREKVTTDAVAWRIDSPGAGDTVRLFEIVDQGLDQSMITYRASLKTENLEGTANLEMCCILPGKGKFTTVGINKTISGTTDWVTDEIPLHLKKGQQPEKLELKVITRGSGKVWVKDLEVLQTPMNL